MACDNASWYISYINFYRVSFANNLLVIEYDSSNTFWHCQFLSSLITQPIFFRYVYDPPPPVLPLKLRNNLLLDNEYVRRFCLKVRSKTSLLCLIEQICSIHLLIQIAVWSSFSFKLHMSKRNDTSSLGLSFIHFTGSYVLRFSTLEQNFSLNKTFYILINFFFNGMGINICQCLWNYIWIGHII